MDSQINDSGTIMRITDFIFKLKNELSEMSVPKEKAIDIMGHLNNENTDYHSMQAIMDILISIPETDRNESLTNIINQLCL